MRLIVIGGGAAGFFCAVNAARMNRALEVTIVEKSGKLLSKVRISGGGRCNVTHSCFSIPDMVKKYPRGGNFVKKTFHDFFTTDTVEWFKERGVRLKTEPDGRMFPVTDSSQTIIDCLMREADKYRVKVNLNKDVKKISRVTGSSNTDDHKQLWHVEYADATSDDAEFLCVATGGYPKASMFDWITHLGHTIEPPVPSLFTFNMPGNPITSLMGVSSNATVKIAGTKLEEKGAVLITHWGLSGPAVLKLSAKAARELNEVNYRFSVLINWSEKLNDQQVRETLQRAREQHPVQKVFNGNVFQMPQRLWEFLCTGSGLDPDMRWTELPSAKMNMLVKNIAANEMHVEGKTTYKEEFVTAGGIKLTEVNPLTMESRIADKLYFAGEILDVDGVTGGFNFQHAWTSGWIAAKSIASKGNG